MYKKIVWVVVYMYKFLVLSYDFVLLNYIFYCYFFFDCLYNLRMNKVWDIWFSYGYVWEKYIFWKSFNFCIFVYEFLVVIIVCLEVVEDKSFYVGIMVVKNLCFY